MYPSDMASESSNRRGWAAFPISSCVSLPLSMLLIQCLSPLIDNAEQQGRLFADPFEGILLIFRQPVIVDFECLANEKRPFLVKGASIIQGIPQHLLHFGYRGICIRFGIGGAAVRLVGRADIPADLSDMTSGKVTR